MITLKNNIVFRDGIAVGHYVYTPATGWDYQLYDLNWRYLTRAFYREGIGLALSRLEKEASHE